MSIAEPGPTNGRRPRVPVFGQPGGPVRFALGLAALLALITLTTTIGRLDLRLTTLVGLNDDTAKGAHQIAAADDHMTRRLQQLTVLAAGAHDTLDQTRALEPILTDLRAAIEPTAAAVTVGRAGGERSLARLTRIRDILQRLNTSTRDLARSASVFDRQGTDLLGILDGVDRNLSASVDAAERIDRSLPLPALGGR